MPWQGSKLRIVSLIDFPGMKRTMDKRKQKKRLEKEKTRYLLSIVVPTNSPLGLYIYVNLKTYTIDNFLFFNI